MAIAATVSVSWVPLNLHIGPKQLNSLNYGDEEALFDSVAVIQATWTKNLVKYLWIFVELKVKELYLGYLNLI